MKFLHTADLHLGIRTEGRDRFEEQRRILHEICDIADAEDVDVVLLAGDIFQSSIPSADAEDVFFEFVEKISKNNRRAVIVIAGNHDSPKRLAAGSYLAEKHNILLACDLQQTRKISVNGVVKFIEQGIGFVKVQKGDDTAVVAYLPYPVESRLPSFSDFDKDTKYADKVKFWASLGAKGFSKDSYNVFVSHLYLAGALADLAGVEYQIDLGGALTVPKSVLPKCHHVALGHLHKYQCLDSDKNIYYSGAPIEIRYFDHKPAVLVFEGTKKGTKTVKKIELKSPVLMDSIEATSVENAKEKLLNYNENDIVEITIVQKDPLKQSEVRELKKIFPCISTIKLKRIINEKAEHNLIENRRNLSKKDLFESFYLNKTGQKPSNNIVEMFLDILEDENETD